MKHGIRNMFDSDTASTTGDTVSNESNAWESSVNTSSSATNKTQEVSVTPKKELSYIFQLDATKKKLERIDKNIDKLQEKMNKLQALYHEKTSMVDFHAENVYASEMEYKRQSSILNLNMKENKISNISSIVDLKKQEIFLRRYMNSYLKQTIVPLLKTSKETDKQKLNDIMNSLLGQERKRMQEILASLYNLHFTVEVEKDMFKVKNEKLTALKKEVEELQKQITELANQIKNEDKMYHQISQNGLLKAYESWWAKISIQDMIAPAHIEQQMKKLISLYTHASEAKRLWLSTPKWILFVGEPETGKTFAAKMFASEIGRKMYHIKAHDLFSENVEDPNAMLYSVFYSIIDNIQKNKESCIVFLDEIEKIVDSLWEYHPANRKMISNTIIKNIINIQKSNLDIVILAALWNRNRIDERFLKYDVFDNQFFFELPKPDERKRLFKLYMQKAEKAAKISLFHVEDLDALVAKTETFSAEYIKQLINSCVKEYLYTYIHEKNSLVIKPKFIDKSVEEISQRIGENRKKPPLETSERKKIISTSIDQYTMKKLVFWELVDDKKSVLLDHIMGKTKLFTESEITELMSGCFDEYERRESEYQKKSLISQSFILEKINELKQEDNRKWKSAYLSPR